MNIDIYTDVICPWCYLGKRRFEMAVDAAQLPDIEVRYLPFELSPSTPPAGVDRRKYLQEKYGDGIKGNDARLTALGAEVGVTFDFERVKRIPNTHSSHRMIWLAGRESLEVQKAVVEGLHRAYFAEGRNIGDKQILAEIATAAGLSPATVTTFLASDAGSEEVRALEEGAMALGVSGVPFFVFDGKTAISGAQSVETFISALQELAG